jgi:hypothetical protein
MDLGVSGNLTQDQILIAYVSGNRRTTLIFVLEMISGSPFGR